MRTLVVPGNHDIPLFDFVERFAAPLTSYQQFISTELEPEYEDEEMIVIGVNTARALVFPFGEGRINERQVDRMWGGWRESDRRSCVWSSRITHSIRPGRPRAPLRRRSAQAMARLAEANADLFLSGHLHISHVSHAVDRYETKVTPR